MFILGFPLFYFLFYCPLLLFSPYSPAHPPSNNSHGPGSHSGRPSAPPNYCPVRAFVLYRFDSRIALYDGYTTHTVHTRGFIIPGILYQAYQVFCIIPGIYFLFGGVPVFRWVSMYQLGLALWSPLMPPTSIFMAKREETNLCAPPCYIPLSRPFAQDCSPVSEANHSNRKCFVPKTGLRP